MLMCEWAHMHVQVEMNMCVHMCGGPRLMSGIIIDGSSTLFIKAASLTQIQSTAIQLVLLASLLWGFLSPSSEVRIPGKPPQPPDTYMGSRDPNAGSPIISACTHTH